MLMTSRCCMTSALTTVEAEILASLLSTSLVRWKIGINELLLPRNPTQLSSFQYQSVLTPPTSENQWRRTKLLKSFLHPWLSLLRFFRANFDGPWCYESLRVLTHCMIADLREASRLGRQDLVNAAIRWSSHTKSRILLQLLNGVYMARHSSCDAHHV